MALTAAAVLSFFAGVGYTEHQQQQDQLRAVAEEVAFTYSLRFTDEVYVEHYEQLPFVPDAKANLTTYVVEKGMDGIFFYLAQQEAAIRTDPAKRTTELLRKVFGADGG